MFVDNGGPWGFTLVDPWTTLTVWLLKLGVRTIHSRPYHPQSRGKNGRFHSSAEGRGFRLSSATEDLADVQRAFDQWRAVYNLDRPHEALGLRCARKPLSTKPSASCRTPSNGGVRRRARPSVLSPPRRPMSASRDGSGKSHKPSVARGSPSDQLSADGKFGIFFAAHQIETIDLCNPKSVNHLPEQSLSAGVGLRALA